MKKKWIPLSIPNFEGNEKKYVMDAVEQAWVSTGGAYVTELERRLASFLHVAETAVCQSGTSALHLAMIGAGVEPGDIVIVPTLTFIAAVNPVRYQNAQPVFMDCDDSLCIDPDKLAQFCAYECEYHNGRLTYGGKVVKAVVVVHVFGNLADMERIMEIAQMYGLCVIEDATEALGSYYTKGNYAGRYAGTIGHYGAYSFNGNKIITTGGGGALTAREPKDVSYLRYLSAQAKDNPVSYIHQEVGYNYRMTNLQAALGVAQMEELAEFIERKHRNYRQYQALFADCACAQLLPFREGTCSNQWFYALRIHTEQICVSLETIIDNLQERGIQTRAVWGLVHKQKPYRDAVAYKIEQAALYAGQILNLPCSTQLTKADICFVAENVKDLLTEYSENKDKP